MIEPLGPATAKTAELPRLRPAADKAEADFRMGQSRILEMVATNAPLHEILKQLVLLIESQSPGMLCSVLLLSDDGDHVRHGAAPSLPEDYVKAIDGAPLGPKQGSCGTAMYRGERVIVTDILKDPLWDDYRELAVASGLRACWSTPIMSGRGKVLGSFAMYYREPRTPTGEEAGLTQVATRIAGLAIEHQARARSCSVHKLNWPRLPTPPPLTKQWPPSLNRSTSNSKQLCKTLKSVSSYSTKTNLRSRCSENHSRTSPATDALPWKPSPAFQPPSNNFGTRVHEEFTKRVTGKGQGEDYLSRSSFTRYPSPCPDPFPLRKTDRNVCPTLRIYQLHRHRIHQRVVNQLEQQTSCSAGRSCVQDARASDRSGVRRCLTTRR